MGYSPDVKKLLLAIRPVELEAVCHMLGEDFRLVICYTLEQAIENLKDDIGMIACSVRFDAGSKFELLSAARANPATREIPYHLVIGEGTRYSPAILENIKNEALLRGVTGVVDVPRLISELGREKATRRIREGIWKGLLANDDAIKFARLPRKDVPLRHAAQTYR